MTSKQITIEQWPHPVVASKKATLLDTALKSGIPYPHECRSGECGQCKSQLLKGEIHQAPGLDGVLSDEERKRGVILACRCEPKTDIMVRWLEGGAERLPFTPRKCSTQVHKIERVAPSVTRLWLTLEGDTLAFAPGQYARLQFGDLPARSYSMANEPGAAMLEFHVAHSQNGHVSRHIAEGLREGDRVNLEGPFGFSYLRDEYEGPLVAIAGGTGLAPVLSIVRTALHERTKTPIHLYFGAQKHHDIYAEEELMTLATSHSNLNVTILHSEPDRNSTWQTGSLLKAFGDFDSLADTCLYTAGPPALVTAIKERAIAKGISADRVHSDAFWSAPSSKAPRKGRFANGLTALLRRRKGT